MGVNDGIRKSGVKVGLGKKIDQRKVGQSKQDFVSLYPQMSCRRLVTMK